MFSLQLPARFASRLYSVKARSCPVNVGLPLAAFLSLCLALPALAGSYEPDTQTGGVATNGDVVSGDRSHVPYYVSGNGDYNFYPYGGTSWADAGSASCTGEIDTTFTWTGVFPYEIIPTYVLVEQNSEAG